LPLSPRWRWKIERWKQQYFGWLFADQRQEMPRPKICPSCGQLAGVNARRCPNCGSSMTFSLAAASRSFSRLLPETSPASYGILFFCCLLYAVSLMLTLRSGSSVGGGLLNFGGISGRVLFSLGASLPLPYNLVQPWRFITAVFLHASLIHIGFNMWVLIDIGPMVEELYGSARYLFLFVLTGAVGFVASSFFGHMSIGASGSLLGLIGILLAVTTKHRKSASAQMLRSQLIRWLIYIAVLGLIPGLGVDNAAHLGGLAAGFLLGQVMKDRPPADLAERKRAYALGWLTGAVVAVSFAAIVLQFVRIP
jgi:membrane associated rhomboid family serine protease